VGGARFPLPAALAGVAGGILGADLGLAREPLAALAGGVTLIVLGTAFGGRAAMIAVLGVALLGSAAGTWRQATTDPSPEGRFSITPPPATRTSNASPASWERRRWWRPAS